MKIRGTKGNDDLFGDFDSDTVHGRKGADFITGGGGDDTLRGGRGTDTLFGGNGNDTLIGGKGRDTFVFNALLSDSSDLYGVDAILDFNPDKDRVVINVPYPAGNYFLYDADTGALEFSLLGADAEVIATLPTGLAGVNVDLL